MKVKKLLHQKKETKESSSKEISIVTNKAIVKSEYKEISTIKESTGKSTNVEIYSEPYQTDIEKFSNKEIQIISTLKPEHLKEMVKNQKKVIENVSHQGGDVELWKSTIPILENVFPKLLIPYITQFTTSQYHAIYEFFTTSCIDITCPDKFNSQSPMIDTIGSKIAFQLDQSYINFLYTYFSPTFISYRSNLAYHMDLSHRSLTVISSQPNRLIGDLDKLIDKVKLDNMLKFSEEDINIALICNNSDEELLQSTKKYYRINNSEFKDKPFKVGVLLNKCIVFVTPAIDKGKAILWNVNPMNLPFYTFYGLSLVNRMGKFEFTIETKLHISGPQLLGVYTDYEVIRFE